jgi:hypothetical protein
MEDLGAAGSVTEDTTDGWQTVPFAKESRVLPAVAQIPVSGPEFEDENRFQVLESDPELRSPVNTRDDFQPTTVMHIAAAVVSYRWWC